MIKAARRFVGTALFAGILAGCTISSETTSSSGGAVQELFTVGKSAVANRRAGRPEKTAVTPEILSQITVPVIQINPEKYGGSDFLRRAVSRNDSGLGTVEVWNSSDNAQIFLRSGVIVGSRGIGGDIIAADANVTIRALRSGARTSGVRRYTISDGDVTTTDYVFQCVIENAGEEGVRIVNQVFRTRHMRETCVGGPLGDARLNNEYWVEPGSGLVRKSRQWIGPSTGYFEIIKIKN